MKLHYPGEKGRAICEADGLASTTFAYRDVPFSDGSGVAKEILVGVCDKCGKVVSIPPQSTPAIKAARKSAEISIEANLPAAYVAALDLACFRIDPDVPLDFRKRLLMYYFHRSSLDDSATRRLASATKKASKVFKATGPLAHKRRLSMKVSPAMSRTVEHLMEKTKLSKTDLIKGALVQIQQDIIEPKRPAHLRELKALAVVTSC